MLFTLPTCFLFTSLSMSITSSYLLQLKPTWTTRSNLYSRSSQIKCVSNTDDSAKGNKLDKHINKNNKANSIHSKIVCKGGPHLTIEYCAGCRWLLRSSWMMQEILTTFEQEMGSVTLTPIKPPAQGGTFLITLDDGTVILWDRRVDGGFPEAKQLKQRLRDSIAPTKSLGHSETNKDGKNLSDCVECEETKRNVTMTSTLSVEEPTNVTVAYPNISITYSTKDGWLFRAAWICQEILTEFQNDINSVTLIPSRVLSNELEGQFIVNFEGQTLWEKREENSFPTFESLKQRIHNEINGNDKEQGVEPYDDLSDDEAADLRQFYGVL